MDRLKRWIKTTKYRNYDFNIASADASFRKYYRLSSLDDSFIVMDSSLELTSLPSFIDITQRLLDVGVKAPLIFEQNLEKGYLIIEDFGSQALLDILNVNNFKSLYIKAMDEIIKMQKADVNGLPFYDKDFLHFEMDLMSEWFLQKNLKVTLHDNDKKMIEKSLQSISDIVLLQPQNVFVHRDYHSRNIMLSQKNEIAIIDYQDAMNGAITYDLVSLLKDCYIAFNRESIEELVLLFRDKIGIDISDVEFLKWFDFMGMQRHIKVLGIFSRLYLRDAKDGYLKDIPLTLKYTIDTALRYEETQELAHFLQRVTK